MQERRKHKRLPVIKDFAEPVELCLIDAHKDMRKIPGVITNLSAGGMDLVLMGTIDGKPKVRMSLDIPGMERFEVEARVVHTRPKGATEIVGLEFTKIDDEQAKKITHMAEVYWEEQREKNKAALKN